MPKALEARLAALEDGEAIRALIASYGPLADAGDAAGVAALFTEDGEYHVGGFAHAVGRPAIAALIEGETHRALMAAGCAHLLGPPAVELAGDAATARNHSVVLRRSGSAWEAWRVSANRWELVRTREGWRVRQRINQLLDGGESARDLLARAAAPKLRLGEKGP